MGEKNQRATRIDPKSTRTWGQKGGQCFHSFRRTEHDVRVTELATVTQRHCKRFQSKHRPEIGRKSDEGIHLLKTRTVYAVLVCSIQYYCVGRCIFLYSSCYFHVSKYAILQPVWLYGARRESIVRCHFHKMRVYRT